ncbi:MAG: sensor domain-containing diguanylate cyclase [Selenomonadaceae bacterium]|nr:sensor domain-containing diguanylate cyclase [Selenomonadaceae bacterium]
MYTPKLNLALAALPDNIADLLRPMVPEGTGIFSLPSLEATDSLPYDVILMGDDAGLTPAEIHRQAPRAIIYLITSDEKAVSPDMLTALQEIWPADMTGSLWGYRLRRMLEDFYARKESFYYRSSLETMINSVPDLIWFKDINGAHLKVNDAFCEFVGKLKSDIEGHDHFYIWGLTEEMYRKGEFVCLETEEEVLRRGVTCRFDERVENSSGIRNLSTFKSPVRDEDGTMLGTLGVAHDVTDELAQKRRLDDMAFSDALTGLYNRHAFYTMMARRRGTLRITIITLDLDNFRLVNECFGHQLGDEALLLFARFLRETFPDNICVRMNSDIFAVALLGEVERSEITDKLDSLFAKIKKSFASERSHNILSVSAGIADTPNPSQSVDDVIRRCGYAVARLKRRNGFTIALDPTKPPSPLLLDLLRTKADSAYCFYDDLQK